jgi:hypothetical protein
MNMSLRHDATGLSEGEPGSWRRMSG